MEKTLLNLNLTENVQETGLYDDLNSFCFFLSFLLQPLSGRTYKSSLCNFCFEKYFFDFSIFKYTISTAKNTIM